MGKYMRKAKTTGEVAVMDLSLGVRTRAKTLALQRQARLHASTPPPAQPPPQQQEPGSGGYLQLRSRRLEKPPIGVNDSKRQKNGHNREGQALNQNPSPNPNSVSGVRVGPADSGSGQKKEVNGEEIQENNSNNNNINNNNDSKDLGIEASFGENVLDIEGRERWVCFLLL